MPGWLVCESTKPASRAGLIIKPGIVEPATLHFFIIEGWWWVVLGVGLFHGFGGGGEDIGVDASNDAPFVAMGTAVVFTHADVETPPMTGKRPFALRTNCAAKYAING